MKNLWGIAVMALGLFATVASAQDAQFDHYGTWTVATQTDPFTDEKQRSIFSPATDYPRLASNSAVAIRCFEDEDAVEVVLLFDTFLDSDEATTVQWRFDSGEVHRKTWRFFTAEGTGVVALPPTDAEFIAELQTADQLYVRAWDYNGTQHDYRFDLEGKEMALDQLGCTLPTP